MEKEVESRLTCCICFEEIYSTFVQHGLLQYQQLSSSSSSTSSSFLACPFGHAICQTDVGNLVLFNTTPERLRMYHGEIPCPYMNDRGRSCRHHWSYRDVHAYLSEEVQSTYVDSLLTFIHALLVGREKEEGTVAHIASPHLNLSIPFVEEEEEEMKAGGGASEEEEEIPEDDEEQQLSSVRFWLDRPDNLFHSQSEEYDDDEDEEEESKHEFLSLHNEKGEEEEEEEEEEKQENENTKLLKTAVQYILDSILNLRCPGCQAVFYDYDACSAVNCAVCGIAFCGLCLEKAPTAGGGGGGGTGQAHAHVMVVHGDLFFNETEIRRQQNAYRRRRLVEYLAGLELVHGSETRRRSQNHSGRGEHEHGRKGRRSRSRRRRSNQENWRVWIQRIIEAIQQECQEVGLDVSSTTTLLLDVEKRKVSHQSAALLSLDHPTTASATVDDVKIPTAAVEEEDPLQLVHSLMIDLEDPLDFLPLPSEFIQIHSLPTHSEVVGAAEPFISSPSSHGPEPDKEDREERESLQRRVPPLSRSPGPRPYRMELHRPFAPHRTTRLIGSSTSTSAAAEDGFFLNMYHALEQPPQQGNEGEALTSQTFGNSNSSVHDDDDDDEEEEEWKPLLLPPAAAAAASEFSPPSAQHTRLHLDLTSIQSNSRHHRNGGYIGLEEEEGSLSARRALMMNNNNQEEDYAGFFPAAVWAPEATPVGRWAGRQRRRAHALQVEVELGRRRSQSSSSDPSASGEVSGDSGAAFHSPSSSSSSITLTPHPARQHDGPPREFVFGTPPPSLHHHHQSGFTSSSSSSSGDPFPLFVGGEDLLVFTQENLVASVSNGTEVMGSFEEALEEKEEKGKGNEEPVVTVQQQPQQQPGDQTSKSEAAENEEEEEEKESAEDNVVTLSYARLEDGEATGFEVNQIQYNLLSSSSSSSSSSSAPDEEEEEGEEEQDVEEGLLLCPSAASSASYASVVPPTSPTSEEEEAILLMEGGRRRQRQLETEEDAAPSTNIYYYYDHNHYNQMDGRAWYLFSHHRSSPGGPGLMVMPEPLLPPPEGGSAPHHYHYQHHHHHHHHHEQQRQQQQQQRVFLF